MTAPTIPEAFRCDLCSGYGVLEDPRSYEHECPLCGGTGADGGRDLCRDCEAGVSEDPDTGEDVDCSTCSGLGAVA